LLFAGQPAASVLPEPCQSFLTGFKGRKFATGEVPYALREQLRKTSQGKVPGSKAAYHLGQGPQFIARDFKEFIRISGMTHVRTSPYYPQSNGKIECWHKSLKSECIRPGTPLSLGDALRLVEGYVEYYNNIRLNSAIGYITRKDMLAGRQQEIHAERDRRLEEARCHRQLRRRQAG
jgi:transposase InsO family protein